MLVTVSCQKTELRSQASVDNAVLEAVGILGLDRGALSAPKLDKSLSGPARLDLVDRMMQDPLRMAHLSNDLRNYTPDNKKISNYLAGVMKLLNIHLDMPSKFDECGTYAGSGANGNGIKNKSEQIIAVKSPGPVLGHDMPPPVREIVLEILRVRATIAAAEWPTREELKRIREHLARSMTSQSDKLTDRLLTPDIYLNSGTGFDVNRMSRCLVYLAGFLEDKLPDLKQRLEPYRTDEWDTPGGRVKFSGTSNDHHSGSYLLLIDLGGDDVYEDVNTAQDPGAVSVVIDLSGNDRVHWSQGTGPGSGVLGLGIWIDVSGDDRYEGGNLGLGTGLFGAGLLWDKSGNDVYRSGSLSQGAAQYGVGILLDEAGDDSYSAAVASQGFGGSGGYGILIDLAGNDHYRCGGAVPDTVAERNLRHGEVRYLSLCQGYGFGMRPLVSGGFGLLLDRDGNDEYDADMFAQGAGTWFGAGMLTDVRGSDSYRAYEHCQGEGLHAGAGFLGDWSGNDSYSAHEHCQGTGVDGSVGFLFDADGNDKYESARESQGAGIKPLGVGLLVDANGDDEYKALSSSQGYSELPANFPAYQQPLGILLDLGGSDRYIYPDSKTPSRKGRVQNRRGLAVDR